MGRVWHAFDFSRSVASNNLQLKCSEFNVQLDQPMYQFAEQLSAV